MYDQFDNGINKPHGSFEVFWDDADIPEYGDTPRNYDADGEPVQPGWYCQAIFPGCLPDGDAVGPFETEQAAVDDANDY